MRPKLLLENILSRDLNYGRDHIEDFFTHRISAPRSALDIGVGDCYDLLALKRIHPSVTLHGIDFRAEKLSVAASQGITPHKADLEIEQLPFGDETLDLIIANQVFEHLKNFFWAFHECCRTLSVGGSLVVGVPNLASLHNRILLMLGRQPTSIKTISAHVRGFTMREFAEAALGIGSGALELTHCCGANFYPLPRTAAKLFARLLPSLAVSSFYVFRKKAPYDAALFKSLGARNLETLYKEHD